VRVTLFFAAKAASRHVPVEAPPRFVSLRAVCFLSECREGSGILSSYPSLCDLSSELVVRHVLVIEDLLDRPLGQLRRDTFLPEFGGEAGFATRSVEQAVTHEGRRNRFVVDEPTFLQSIETRVDTRRTEALLAESPPEFLACAYSVRNQVERGVTYADVLVGVEQVVARIGGQGVADAKSTSFERLEHHLERIAFVEMNEDF